MNNEDRYLKIDTEKASLQYFSTFLLIGKISMLVISKAPIKYDWILNIQNGCFTIWNWGYIDFIFPLQIPT